MNQELMTLDFWQDTVIYEGKTLPVGALACDALNVPADTIAKMNEQCEKINLLLGILNAGQDASALCPIATEAALTMLDILSQTPPFSYMNISKHRELYFQKTLQILLLSPPHAIGVYIIESLFLAQQSGVKWKKAFWI